MMQKQHRSRWLVSLGLTLVSTALFVNHTSAEPPETSKFARHSAPAGTLPATMHTVIDGYDAAVLPTGRLITPAGKEIFVGAPKPYGLALSPDGTVLATTNNGTGPFSVTL